VKKTVFLYAPAEAVCIGGSYLLKGVGKGEILTITTDGNRTIDQAGESVPTERVRQFTVRFADGRVITACPAPRGTKPQSKTAQRKAGSANALPLAGNKGVWLR
jgi:hypothetical protein